jgi:hypothetical protein
MILLPWQVAIASNFKPARRDENCRYDVAGHAATRETALDRLGHRAGFTTGFGARLR